MFGAPFDGMQVLLPGGWAPQLEVVVVAGHDDLALEAGVRVRAAGTSTRPCPSRSASAAPEKKNVRSSRASRESGSSAEIRSSTLTFQVSRGYTATLRSRPRVSTTPPPSASRKRRGRVFRLFSSIE